MTLTATICTENLGPIPVTVTQGQGLDPDGNPVSGSETAADCARRLVATVAATREGLISAGEAIVTCPS